VRDHSRGAGVKIAGPPPISPAFPRHAPSPHQYSGGTAAHAGVHSLRFWSMIMLKVLRAGDAMAAHAAVLLRRGVFAPHKDVPPA